MENKKKTSLKASYTLMGVTEQRFCMNSVPQLDERFNTQNMSTSIIMFFGTNFEDKTVAIDIQINYFDHTATDDSGANLLNFRSRVEFEVSDMSSINLDGNLKKGILPALVDIAVNTSRGMLIGRTSGTIYRLQILPLIDPIELIDELIKAHEERLIGQGKRNRL
jgi:hypothetical protein